MQNRLFYNTIEVKTGVKEAIAVIADPYNLVKWAPDVAEVDPKQHYFMVRRRTAALNNFEKINIEVNENTVVYHSRGGQLEYDLEFELTRSGLTTHIQESMEVLQANDLKLPVKLLAPIAKRAFSTNLKSLGVLIERVTTK